MQTKTIPQWLTEVANNNSSSIAITSADNRPSLTYQALLEQTQTIATLLYSIGLKSGDIVAIALDNGADFLTSILSVASVATAFPLNPNQPQTEFERYFARLDIKAIIVANDSNSAIRTVANSVNIPILELSWDLQSPAGQFSLLSRGANKPLDTSVFAPKLSDNAILVGTSGSTGQPKIISLTHESFFVSINHAADWMQLNKSDRSLVLTPLAMLHALVRSSCPLLLRGGEVVCTSGYNPAEILNWLDRYQPTFFTGVPSIYRSLLQRIEATGWISQNNHLRFLVTGSDKINAVEIDAVEKTLGVPLIQFYGMSEVSPLPVVSPFPPAVRPTEALGKINPIWQAACVDEEGKHLPTGEEGEIIIRGGYINRLVGTTSEEDNKNVRDGWFYTGDLGYLDEDGCFYYTGRVDDRINRGGKKVYAGDVEAMLLTCLEIKQAVVFGIPDTVYGQTIGAVVVLEDDATRTPESIQQFLAKHIVGFKIPDKIIIADALPLNRFRKVKRKTLAAHYGLENIFEQKLMLARTTVETEYVASETETEQKLIAIWSDLLKLPQVDVDDNFFELGGDSLFVIQLLAQIKSQLKRELSANVLFDAPTIKQLALILDKDDDSEPKDCLVALRSGGDRPALFLVHDADGDVIIYLNLAHHLKLGRAVYGLRPYGKEGFPILDWKIEQIVDRYIERILAVQPEGPYYVGGLCDGGIYAYEIACQLQARGHQVGLVALLDAIDYEAVRYEFAEDVKKVRERDKYEMYRDLLASGAKLPDALKDRISVRMMLILAKEGYVPQKFRGKLLLFRATAREYPASETPQYVKIEDPLFGWQQRATEGVEVYDLPDTHSGILREPSVKLLANHLEQVFAVRDRILSSDLSKSVSEKSADIDPVTDLRISIVVVARTAAEAVVKTIESIVQQTFANWEAIVIDDGKSDRLTQTIISFAEEDSRITLVPQSQIIAGAARNHGAELAQYDWLLFIEAGDWLFPEHLEKLTAQLTAVPQSDLIFGNWALFSVEDKQNDSLAYNIADFTELQSNLLNHLKICNQFPLHACLIKKKVFKEVNGFTEDLVTCEDWDLWQRIIASERICWSSIDLVLAGCLPKQKVKPEQLAKDGFQIITRGYKNDPRFAQPQSDSAKSSFARKIADAHFYWAGYCSAMAIAMGRDYLPILNCLADRENFAALSIDFEQTILDRAIIDGIRNVAYTCNNEFEALWCTVQPKITEFIQKLAQDSEMPLKASSRMMSIETIILELTSKHRPISLTQFQAVDCDLTQPITNYTITSRCQILNCRVHLGEKLLGTIDLPVFDGQVSKLVIADAIAESYVWIILDSFFKKNIYSQLKIEKTESNIVVKRGDFILAEDLTPNPDLRQQISERITWPIFLQELWGLIDWEQDMPSNSTSPVLMVNGREWLVVELSDDLADVVVTQDELNIVVQVGGVSIGVLTITVDSKVITSAKLRREIVAQAGFELALAAVREGLLGQPLTGELSLRQRLSQAAKNKRNQSLPHVANNALPSTGNLVSQYLSSEPETTVLGYRLGQAIGTSASRWAMLPKSMMKELAEADLFSDELAIANSSLQSSSQQILYAPDLIVPQMPNLPKSKTLNSIFDGNGNSQSSEDTYELPILMYHHVSPLASLQSSRWNVSPQLFEEQLFYLQEQGFYSVTLEDWRRSIATCQPLPGKAVILTFDDGYQNFSEYAWPLLKKYGFSAIVFLIVNAIGSEMENNPCLGWSQIKQLQAEGVEFGSHSLDHPFFTDISHEELVRQAMYSRAILSKELGVAIDALAYPYGDRNSLVQRITGACGYVFGLDIGDRRSTWQDSLLGLSRIEIQNKDTLPRFMFKLNR